MFTYANMGQGIAAGILIGAGFYQVIHHLLHRKPKVTEPEFEIIHEDKEFNVGRAVVEVKFENGNLAYKHFEGNVEQGYYRGTFDEQHFKIHIITAKEFAVRWIKDIDGNKVTNVHDDFDCEKVSLGKIVFAAIEEVNDFNKTISVAKPQRKFWDNE